MQRHDPCKIFVRGINPQLSDADVLATFAVHGEILRYTKSLKKEFAFVTFDDPESAYNARTRVARVAGHPVECRQAWVEWGPNAEEHTVHKRPHSSRSDFGAGGLHRLDAPGSTFAPKVPRRLRRGRNPTEAGLGDLRAEERAALRDQLGGGRQQGGGDDRSAERDSGWSSRQKRGGRRESDRGYEEKKSGGKHEDGGGSKGGKRERGREEKRDSHGRRSQVGRSRSRSPQRSGRRDNYYDYPPPSHRRRRSNSPRSPRFSPASPALPSFSPASPVFSPAAPSFSPTSPRFSLASSPHRSPTSPRFSPASPRYSPTSPRFSPAEISYSPASPSFSPGSPVPRARAPHMDHPQPSSSQLPAMPSESGFDAQDLTTRLEGAQEPTTVSGRASSDHREPSNQPVTRDSTLTPLSDLEARRSATPMDAEPEAQLGDSTEPQTSVETVTEEENEQNAEDAVEPGSGSKGGFKKGSFVPVENEKGARSGRGGQHGGGRDEEEDEVNGEDGRGGGRDGDERSASGHGGGRRRDSEREGFIDEHCRLAVRNLSKVCTSDSLRSFAAECGRVGAVSVHLNFIGEGMLEYSTMAEADEALRSLNGRPLHGMAVRLERY